MAMKNVLKQPEKNAQRGPGEKGWACYYCGKEEHLKWDCPQASKLPLDPCPACKDQTGGETAPRGVGLWGRTLKTIRTEGARGVPTQAPILITPEEPRVLIIVGGKSVDFLLDTGTTYSVLTEAPGPLSSRSTTIMGLSG